MAERILKLGVAGLGRGFMLMLPTLAGHPRLRLVAAADPRPEARRRFAEDFGGRGHASVEELCADPEVEAVYVATPHQFHVAHVGAAAAHGKHVLVEKPMALTLEDCRAMIDAAAAAGVHLLVGHSHSFDSPVLRTRALIASGAFGRVRMITAMNYTDFLYRPRRPEELDTARGGGVVFSQAAHQMDVVRLLGGGRVAQVQATTGAWDPARPTEGAYAAHLRFADGAFASLTYSGYGHFDTDEFCGWVGELGQERDPDRYGTARAALARVASPEEEAALKNARAYGTGPAGRPVVEPPRHHNHFGLLVVSCERADLRPTPDGILVYGDRERYVEPVPLPPVPRAEVIDELYDAVVNGRRPLHDGAWGMATTEACLALLRSAREGVPVALRHQTAADALQ
ncbi:Gfo/Idh/MocA family protein [Azospirillum sp. ST 5-10]|uniref:Gfo/Idh/MocA family protein n=1 Tax=unclassified Azospirillum TaxID=2630922 RepID=UPI003F49BF68